VSALFRWLGALAHVWEGIGVDGLVSIETGPWGTVRAQSKHETKGIRIYLGEPSAGGMKSRKERVYSLAYLESATTYFTTLTTAWSPHPGRRHAPSRLFIFYKVGPFLLGVLLSGG